METVLYAYQMIPGKDDLLWFAATQNECQLAAIAQRSEMKKAASEDLQIEAMCVYRFVFRDLRPTELVDILNCASKLLDIAVVDRRFVSFITE